MLLISVLDGLWWWQKLLGFWCLANLRVRRRVKIGLLARLKWRVVLEVGRVLASIGYSSGMRPTLTRLKSLKMFACGTFSGCDTMVLVALMLTLVWKVLSVFIVT